MKPFTLIAVVIFALVSIIHLLRFFLGWQVTVNTMIIPMWVSLLGVVVAGGLAIMLWREMKQ